MPTVQRRRDTDPMADAPRHIPYAGETVPVLGATDALAFCEMTIPAGFGGPPPHIHHGFDEALYVVDGELTYVTDRNDPVPAPPGTLILAGRGVRHTFANPGSTPAKVLGVWSPASALEFMAEIGAALPATGRPDPDVVADIYRRHNGFIVP